MSKSKNEFLRRKPGQNNRNVLFDLTNFIIPAFLIITGLIVATQEFAFLMNYEPSYVGNPVFIMPFKFLLPKGYCFYSPLMATLSLSAGSTDEAINNAVLPTVFYFLAFTVAAVVSFFLVSTIRGWNMNKNDNLYGTARWGTEKDLDKFGLLQSNGVVLAQLDGANVYSQVNPENASVSLHLHKQDKLICHGGGTNTLLLAPTRSGKGVGSIIPTLLSYSGHMIVFDPKGELYNITAGYRRKFSHVIKFSPVSKETARFNPLAEMSRNEGLQSEIDLIASIIFNKVGGGDDKNDFWDNMAMLLFNSVIYHILTAAEEVGKDENEKPIYKDKYKAEEKNISNAIHILALASAEKTKNEDGSESESGGETFLTEMIESPHIDEKGIHQTFMDNYVKEGASKLKAMNPKVRSDVYSTLFAKVSLFSDAFISNLTSQSDFSLEDFYESKEPITLYLTVPYGQMTRVMPVFSLLINFILNRFSSGEIRLGVKEKKLSHRLLFLLDEFPALQKGGQQIHNNLGVLAGYGITFYLICQSLSQLDTIYGKDHSFLSNCKTVMIYAPGELEPAKKFSEMIGKESVTKESISASGSRYSVAFNNLNASSQEVARDLINPDELMKLPPNQALIMNQGMPPYMAKKCVYYEDSRFAPLAYSNRKIKIPSRIGYKVKKDTKILGVEYKKGDFLFSVPLKIPFTKINIFEEEIQKVTGWEAPYDIKEILAECQSLPSNKNRKLIAFNEESVIKKQKQKEEKRKKIEEEKKILENAKNEFEPFDFINIIEEEHCKWSSEILEKDVPHKMTELNLDIFDKEN